jgi:DNA-binding response OmpR family regulator
MIPRASILVVEDQATVRTCLVQLLQEHGYQVRVAKDGIEALAVLRAEPVDLILADIMMPGMDGYTLHEHVAGNPEWVAIPFVFLTARLQDNDIRRGKEMGVDDYLVKPVAAEDLMATVRGKLHRAERMAQAMALTPSGPRQGIGGLILGRLRVEPGEYRVWMDGERVKLSNTEFRLLECLAQRASRVVAMQELVKATHSLDTTYAEASDLLRPMIRSLRRKLGYSAGDMGCIESVRGVGYRLVASSEQTGTRNSNARM